MKSSRHGNQICLTIVNGLFLFAGGAGLIAGLLLHVDPSLVGTAFAGNNIRLSLSNPSFGFVISVVCLGSVVVSLVGCIGALCKLTAVLVLYSLILIVVLATEIAGAIFLTVHDGNSSIYLEESLQMLVRGYNETAYVLKKGSKIPARILFAVFGCCGVNGISDFDGSHFQWERDPSLRAPNASSYSFPLICCHNVTLARDAAHDVTGPKDGGQNVKAAVNVSQACLGNVTEDTAYFRGCLPVIEDLLVHYSDILIITGITAGLLEILMIVLSARQCIQYRRKLIYEQTSLTCPHPPSTRKRSTTFTRNPPLIIPTITFTNTSIDAVPSEHLPSSITSSPSRITISSNRDYSTADAAAVAATSSESCLSGGAVDWKPARPELGKLGRGAFTVHFSARSSSSSHSVDVSASSSSTTDLYHYITDY